MTRTEKLAFAEELWKAYNGGQAIGSPRHWRGALEKVVPRDLREVAVNGLKFRYDPALGLQVQHPGGCWLKTQATLEEYRDIGSLFDRPYVED